ncbi:2,3-diketo-L-gulonate reductase [Citrobacter koseri]|uniref:2,3-diketo-L-gulonate reductase n=1 Tax=Citrobacter koseri TaxID=545 RepID=A0A3S4IER6_CITKO|nr:2,3-diketo-L-gulonate reductase [Citrobacter koseri]
MRTWQSVCQATNLPRLRDENRRNGITVDDSVWAKIQAL